MLTAGARVERIQVNDPAGTFARNLTGNEFKQALVGGAGADRLSGMGGDDVLSGGAGMDVLTGGSGKDTFLFNTALGATNVDTIVDFNAAADTIRLENSVMAALGATGALGAARFAANAAGQATAASHRIVYDTDSGNLFYDANGSAAGGSVLFATLTGHPTISAADFVVS